MSALKDKIIDNMVKKIRQQELDIRFLRKRAQLCGGLRCSKERSWGISSNAIVNLAFGGVSPRKNEMPHDQSDLDACERAVKSLPRHRRTPKVMKALDRARKAVSDMKKFREEQRVMMRGGK